MRINKKFFINEKELEKRIDLIMYIRAYAGVFLFTAWGMIFKFMPGIKP